MTVSAFKRFTELMRYGTARWNSALENPSAKYRHDVLPNESRNINRLPSPAPPSVSITSASSKTMSPFVVNVYVMFGYVCASSSAASG